MGIAIFTGVGIIVAIGDHTAASPVKLGDRVGIKWLADSCLSCELCRRGYEMSESILFRDIKRRYY